MEWYVYVIEWPVELGGTVFYVGKGKGRRMWRHLETAKRPYNGRAARCLYLLLNALLSVGMAPNVRKVFETDSEIEALEEERRLIAFYPDGSLLNTQKRGSLGMASRQTYDEEAANALIALYKELGSWRAVADKLGLNKGLLHQVVNGQVQYSTPVRRALGLPSR